MVGASEGRARVEIRELGTTVLELETLRDWPCQNACTAVATESTGSYWKPLFNVPEDHLEVVLANPRHVKSLPGHKTDRKDGIWLAHLLRPGLMWPEKGR